MSIADDYPAGVKPERDFDLPSVGNYQKHRACDACERGPHPARLCDCQDCEEMP